MRKISNAEHKTRQFALRTLTPVCLRALNRASRLAETRIRRSFAIERHVRGSGIEVGAAATPAVVPLGTKVKYVDKYGLDRLQADPELEGLEIRAPDIIASAEHLEGIADDTQDFVLAFSLLEHVQDVLRCIESFLRVTRTGGAIVMSVPDKRCYGPDKPRPITPFDHFVRDYREGPEWSCADHFREVGSMRFNLSEEELERFVDENIATDAHTHFHVWDAEAFISMLLKAKQVISLDYEVIEFAAYGHEVLVVLKACK